MPLDTPQVAWSGIWPALLWLRAFVSDAPRGQSCCRPVHFEVPAKLFEDPRLSPLGVSGDLLEAHWPADEIADRARRQSELGEEPDGGAGRDHVGEVLLGMGGDQYHW
jgi:hypothetical protein